MAKTREELVGKRFLSVGGGGNKLKLSKITEWDWRAGVIRACTHTDSKHHDLQVRERVRARESEGERERERKGSVF